MANQRATGGSDFWFALKTAVYVSASAVLASPSGPVGAFAAAAGTLYARTTMLSLATAYSGDFCRKLQELAASGHLLVRVQKHCKPIDRVFSSFDRASLDPEFMGDVPDVPVQTHESGVLVHSVLAICVESPPPSETEERTPARRTPVLEWIQVEFAREGLKYKVSRCMPVIPRSYSMEERILQGVPPDVLLEFFERNKDRTYNALSWNCNDVAEAIWNCLISCSYTKGDLRDTNGGDVDDRICKLCLDRPKTIVLVPCGHYHACEECADQLGPLCPWCSRAIIKKQRIFG